MIWKTIEKRSSLENPNTPITGERLVESLGGGRGDHGQIVNPSTAMQLSAVYAAVKVISETIASLPLHVYERTEGGKMRADAHPLYNILHIRPNVAMSKFAFWETVMSNILLYGNAFIETLRGPDGRVSELWLIDPTEYEVRHDEKGEKYLLKKVRVGDDVDGLVPGQFIHIPGLGYDGIRGYSPIALLERSLGISMAAEEYGAKWFGSGAQIGGVLTTPNPLKPEIAQRLKQQFERSNHGKSSQHRTLVLEGGMKWERIGVPPEEAQFLQTREFGVEEIARIFRVPPHKLGDLSDATYSNIENQSIAFVQDTIRPWLVRIEEVINWEVFQASERGRYFAEWSVEGLLRGDIKTRYDAYSAGIQNGFLTRNEVRSWENLNPIEGGDELLVPMNMQPEGDEPEPEQDDERSSPQEVEARARREDRSIKSRARLRAVFEKTMFGVLDANVRAEADRIISMTGRIEDGSMTFEEFIRRVEKFHDENRESFTVDFGAILAAYGSSIIDALELNDDQQDRARLQLDSFSREYAETYADHHRNSSVSQLTSIGNDANALRQRAEEWRDGRAEKEAHAESVRSGGALAKMAYLAAGFTYLIWRTVGDSCPICAPLNGMTVGVRENFFNPGDVIEGEGFAPVQIREPKSHPPVHRGCDCLIVAR